VGASFNPYLEIHGLVMVFMSVLLRMTARFSSLVFGAVGSKPDWNGTGKEMSEGLN
jgi:hypothetical protein